MYEEHAVRIEMFGDEIEALSTLNPVTGEVVTEDDRALRLPGQPLHRWTGAHGQGRSSGSRTSSASGSPSWSSRASCLEAQRLRMRTTYDLEMMRQVGSCSGIENYSQLHRRPRRPARAPNCLLDYFPEDFLLVIDESHVTVPQIGGMYEGDMSRKRTLVEHGFRLPSAMDNRPLTFDEFLQRVGQTVYLSATPGTYELATRATASSSRSSARPG